jgi:aryl-alcohol dehydrogenase-like predicted oxidoreductase
MNDFTHRMMRVPNKSVFRLGLALSYGIDANGTATALDRGVNYLFCASFRPSKSLAAVREALKRDRDKYVVVSGPTLGYFKGSVRRGTEKILKTLGTDYLDVLQLFGLGMMSAWTKGTVEALQALKQEGKVRSIGVSTHDRKRAGRLAEDSPLDLLMIRYNAAHPGAEQDIFPKLELRKSTIVTYTATCWRKLLCRPKGWDGPVMTPGDCYRFCLSSPHVDVVLTGPANRAQLEENLAAMDKGPLNPDEDAWMRKFGRAVHG